MPTFEIQAADGKTYEVDAPNAGAAIAAIRQVGAPKAEPRPDVSSWESAGRGALQGATFGFSDEAWGALRGGYDTLATGGKFTDNYARVRDETRKANERARVANPGAYLAGEIGGSVALPLGAGRAGARLGLSAAERAIPQTLAARSWQGAKYGAGYGGLFGLGTAQGDAYSQLGSTAAGAIGGAAVGAALPPVVDAGSALWSGLTRPIRSELNPTAMGREKIAEALMRDRNPSGVPQPGTIDATMDRLSRAQGTKPDMMLADMGGENTRNLLRSAANMPSTGAQRLNRALDARQANQWRRVEQDITASLGQGNEAYATADAMQEGARRIAAPLFDKAFSANLPASKELIGVLERPHMKRLVQLAEEQAVNEGQSLQNLRPLEVLHRVKMQIDRQIGQAKRGIQDSKANWDVRTLTGMKKDLLKEIKVPEYHEALKAYSGPMAFRNAIEDGMDDALRLPIEELAAKLRSLPAGEQTAYRMGAARAIVGKVRQGNVMQDRTEGLFSSPDFMKRAEILFPDQRARREFQRNLVLEARMADTRKAVQGNSTTAKQLAQGQEAGQPVAMVSAAANAASGRFAPLFQYLERQGQRFSGLTPRTANEIIDAAMQGPGPGSKVVRALMEAERKAAGMPRRRQAVERALSRAGVTGQDVWGR